MAQTCYLKMRQLFETFTRVWGLGIVRSPDSDCSPASFVHWMGKPKASESGAICTVFLEIVLPGGLLPPLFLPPPNSLQTRICVSMGFPVIWLTPGSVFILTSQEDVFSGLLRQESGAGRVWGYSSFVFAQPGEIGGFCQTDLSTFQVVSVLSTLSVIHCLWIKEVFGSRSCETGTISAHWRRF